MPVFAICITCYAVPYIADNLLYKGWSDIKWDYAKILTIVVAIEAAFPLSSWLIELMHVIMPSTGKKQQKQQG